MPDERIEYAKQLLTCVAKPERVIVQAIIDNPELFDTDIAKIVGASKTRVQVVRKQLGIPPVIQFPLKDVPADELIEDNARLDAGDCQVDLQGDYLKRYMEIRSHKERRIAFKTTVY